MKRRLLLSGNDGLGRFLAATFFVTMAAPVWMGWSSYRSIDRIEAQQRRAARMAELKGAIVHMDEVLTMSARMAAATGDPQWERRYRTFEPKLDAAIKEAMELVPAAGSGEVAAKTDAANIALVAMENRAFELVRKSRHNEATAILFGDEYTRHKRAYAEGMIEFSAVIDERINNTLGQNRHVAMNHALVAGTVVALLAFIWVVFLRAARRWRASLAENEDRLIHQSEDLSELNRSLEKKVEQRTRKLAESNESLTQEVADRRCVEERLRKTVQELERFNRLTVGRENRMIELKREINEMARKAGVAPPYDSQIVTAELPAGDEEGI